LRADATFTKLRRMRALRFVIPCLALSGPSLLACQRSAAPAPPAAPAPAADARPAEKPKQPWDAPTDVFAPPADAERLPNGVARKRLTQSKSEGAHPTLRSYVDVHYAGWERNGRQFEGTAPDGPPRRYDVKDLVEGLRDEVVQMVEGERRRLWIPAALAYGKRTNFANAPKGDMTYEVELVRIVPWPPVPENVAAAPKSATTTKSGLAYTVLKKGAGKVHPTEKGRAEVVYAAWTPAGEMFQTSLMGGDTIPVRLSLLPAGWREAMLKMVEGDKWRLWLPGKLAFGELEPGQEALPFGPPPGPVVFDVELVKILE
jgi:peptidylprolyl isomerase